MDFLPQIGGVAFGATLAALLQIAKAAGLPKRATPWITILAGMIWAGLAVGLGYFPAAQPWAAWAISLILTLASVPFAASQTYHHVIKPAARSR